MQKELIEQLCKTENIFSYLEQLAKVEQGLIIMSAKDTLGYRLSEQIDACLKKIGFTNGFVKKHWRGFAGIIANRTVIYEKIAEWNQSVLYEGKYQGLQIRVLSRPYNDGNRSEIEIDGINYSVNKRGINIVVYDCENGAVIDAVCFDTHSEDLRMTRKNPFHIRYGYKIKPEKILPEKIEVRVFWEGEIHFWNVIKSVVNAFRADGRFHVAVVCWQPPNYGTCEDKMKMLSEEGVDGVLYKESDIRTSDIVITMPYDRVMKVVRNEKLVVAIPISLVENLAESLLDTPDGVHVDYFIYDKLIYEDILKRGINTPKNIMLGNPKMDEIYLQLNNRNLTMPQEWSKLRKKRVFLWTTDHVWYSGNVTFDLYARAIFSYFEKNKECALIFRPHPVFIAELLNNGFWNPEDLKQFRNYFKNTDNMVWDELPDYSMSYAMSDAILTDVNCGIIVSALTTKKPICILRRFDKLDCRPLHPELTEMLYNAFRIEECMDFFAQVKKNPKHGKDCTEMAFRKFISHFDGKNGQRIKDFVTEEYLRKYG